MPDTHQAELSRRARLAIQDTGDEMIGDLWIFHDNGCLNIVITTGTLPPVRTVYTEGWADGKARDVRSAEDVEYALNKLRQIQILGDLADV